jgi:hypothetical protein
MNQIEREPVIEEIREVRRRISRRFDHDPTRLVAYYMETQEQYRDQLTEKPEARERREPSGL